MHPTTNSSFLTPNCSKDWFASRTLAMTGFTLAEVLITLVVLGIIAAITVPTLRNSLDDKRYKVPLKKVYSVLSEAFDQTIKYSNFSRHRYYVNYNQFFIFAKEFLPHVAVSKVCCAKGSDVSSIDCYMERTNGLGDDKCLSSAILSPDKSKNMSYPINTNIDQSLSLQLKDGASVAVFIDKYNAQGVVNSTAKKYFGIDPILRKGAGYSIGTCVYMDGDNTITQEDLLESTCNDLNGTFTIKATNEAFFTLIVDVNGLKGPNQAGKDVHAFIYTYSDGLIPAGSDSSSTESIDTRWDFTAEYLNED